MKPSLGAPNTAQLDMLRPQLRDIVALDHPLVKLADAIDWADLLLVTGTTIVNGTIEPFLTDKPVLFYGTTIAGAAEMMGWKRFCARGK